MAPLRSYFPKGVALRRSLSALDVLVVAAVLLLLYGVLRTGSGAAISFNPHKLQNISTSAWKLPEYAARSLLRMFVALFFSTIFTLIYGYVAARSRRAEKVMIPILDILQSVPVLGFLTITVTFFLGLFPGSELGLEAASVFAIFTAQAWNMTFSFYASIKALPRELDELSRTLRLTKWQRFWKIEVPNGMIGLVWNGMMSFGGSWFFLVASEAITVKGTSYSLPGVGSYAGNAINNGDVGAIILAIVTMVLMVVAVNVVFWRPLVAWSEKFRFEQVEAVSEARSTVLNILLRSRWPRTLGALWRKLAEPVGRAMRILGRDDASARPATAGRQRIGDIVFWIAVAAVVIYGGYELLHFVATSKDAGLGQIPKCLLMGLVTFGRVLVLLVFATVVWVPIAVWIGSDARRSGIAQPIVQVLASFPANFLFPLAVLVFEGIGLSINIGSIVLMALGAQWYILFNVIAGTSAIPSDLREAMDVFGVKGWQRWKQLIIPGIMTSYVTGAITAAGGAWNASIVAEVVSYHHRTLDGYGLGAYIVHASGSSNEARLICGVIVMSFYVVGANRLFWRRLYALAEDRFSL